MECNVIATGSKGNAVLLNNSILIDCGVPYSAVKAYEQRIQYLFLTHEHGDHVKMSTIKRLLFNRPTIRIIAGKHLAPKLADISPRNLFFADLGKTYITAGIKFKALPLVHDVVNIAWDMSINGETVIYATDTAELSHIEAKGRDLYLIEGNYKIAEIAQRMSEKRNAGLYCYEERVLKTHLSVEAANRWLLNNIGENSQYILLHEHGENSDGE